MPGFQKKIKGHDKRQEKMQSEETKQVPESNGDKTQILELSDRGFRITVIKMQRDLMEKINNMQEQMDNISRRWE